MVATPAPVRTVCVADPDAPGEVLVIRLRWLCPVPTCRRPRGEPVRRRLAYHDAAGHPFAHARIDLWHNACGHVDLTRNLIAEAAAVNGVPRPRHQSRKDNR